MAIINVKDREAEQHPSEIPPVAEERIEFQQPQTRHIPMPDRDASTYLKLQLLTNTNEVLLRLISKIGDTYIFQNTSLDANLPTNDKFVAFFRNDQEGIYAYREEDALNFFSDNIEKKRTRCIGRFKTYDSQKNPNEYKQCELYGGTHYEQVVSSSGGLVKSCTKVQGFITGDAAQSIYYKINLPSEQAAKTVQNTQPKSSNNTPPVSTAASEAPKPRPLRESSLPTYFALNPTGVTGIPSINFKLDAEKIHDSHVVREFVSEELHNINGQMTPLRMYFDSRRYILKVYIDNHDGYTNGYYEAIPNDRKEGLVMDVYMNKSTAKNSFYLSGKLGTVKYYGKFSGPQASLFTEILSTNSQIYLDKKNGVENNDTFSKPS